MPNPFAANVEALTRHFGIAPGLQASAPGEGGRPHSEIGLDAAWLESVLPSPLPEVLCAVGIGDHAFDALVQRVATDPTTTTRIVLLEPDADAASQLLSRRPWTSLIEAGRLALLVGPDYAGLANVARVMPGLGRAPVIIHPALASRPDVVGRARDVLARLAFNQDANATARRALSGRYLLNTLANAPSLPREGNTAHLKDRFAGRPALIAAAGPSLNRNINELALVKDNALVIACDTAALPMLNGGLPPHIVVAVDASEANARHLAAFPSGRAWLAAEASLHPSAVRPFAGRTFFFKVSDHEPWPWLASLGLDRARLDAWGSVTTTAFALALEMGCDPIVFIGADLAFTGGLPYCRGTSFESMWASWVGGGDRYDQVWDTLLKRWPATEAPGLDGAPVRTAPHLLAFRDWIAERAAARADRTIVNGTGAGVLAGTAIRQATPGEPFWTKPKLDRDEVMRAFAEAHAAGVRLDALTPIFASAMSVVAGPLGDHDPLVARWLTFTDHTITGDQIRAVMASPEQQAWALGASAYRRLMEASA